MIVVKRNTAYVVVQQAHLTPNEAILLARDLMKAAVEATRIQKNLEVMV